MIIKINNSKFDKSNRNLLLADIFQSIAKYLRFEEPIVIEIESGTSSKRINEVLRAIADIIYTNDILDDLTDIEDESDNDPADWWKS